LTVIKLLDVRNLRGGWIAAGLRVTTHIADHDKVTDRHQIDKIHFVMQQRGYQRRQHGHH
jgi:hypothetical protein